MATNIGNRKKKPNKNKNEQINNVRKLQYDKGINLFKY